ncbi:hypothetical protein GCM10010112_26330 [Actinoplanes lobatus]|nr:hypothetical protein GCM10010112_26330 [Actinoplanes lobatus]
MAIYGAFSQVKAATAAGPHPGRRRRYLQTVTDTWDEEFSPSAGALNTLRWAYGMGATTLGEAYDMLEQLELSNDVPEVLGHDDTVENVREELDFGLETVGPDAPLTSLL